MKRGDLTGAKRREGGNLGCPFSWFVLFGQAKRMNSPRAKTYKPTNPETYNLCITQTQTTPIANAKAKDADAWARSGFWASFSA